MLYQTPTKFLSSIFLFAEDVKPDSKTVDHLTRELIDYNLSPTLAQEDVMNVVKDRVALINNELGLLVSILGGRVNVEQIPNNQESSNMKSFNEFLDLSGDILTKIIIYLKREGNRLACVQEGLLNKEIEFIHNLPSKLFKYPKLFTENTPFEWDWRNACEIQRTFGDTTEITNTILTI